MVERVREIGDKIERETRFYITSLAWPACRLGPVVRSHWAIENSLHWVMDMIFRDDECCIRTEHAPANFTTIKHMAHNLIREAPGKPSFRGRQNRRLGRRFPRKSHCRTIFHPIPLVVSAVRACLFR
jgi:predicted transposase YbfD/YdcC